MEALAAWSAGLGPPAATLSGLGAAETAASVAVAALLPYGGTVART